MAGTARARAADIQEPAMNSASRALLLQLEEAHEQLFWEMANMDELTRGSQPDDCRFASARWRISQASLRRRTVAARVDEFLKARVSDGDLIQLQALRDSDQQLLRRSAKHVSIWTIHGIRQDWAAYCDASREIRNQMKAHLQLERQTLDPLLTQLANRRSS